MTERITIESEIERKLLYTSDERKIRKLEELKDKIADIKFKQREIIKDIKIEETFFIYY